MLFDTHCHLNFACFENDLQHVVSRADEANVKFMLNIGCDTQSNHRALKLSEAYNYFYAALGIHPHFSEKADEIIWEKFEEMAGGDIVAIGECGLDYYRKLSPKEKQKEIFQKQIKLSKKLNLPLILHCRGAEDDLISMLRHYNVKRAIAHCFSGNQKYLDFCIEHKFFISFAGNITYPAAENLRDLSKQVPLDLLLFETDCPFLSPQAKRKKRCEPSYLTYTRDELSRIKSVEPGKLEEITTSNALRCFKIKL